MYAGRESGGVGCPDVRYRSSAYNASQQSNFTAEGWDYRSDMV